jgi:uncharacterized membrane protein
MSWSFAPRRIFLAGLVITLPAVVSAYVLLRVFLYFDSILDPLVRRWLHMRIPGLGLLALVCLVFLVGLFASNLLGARIVRAVSRRLERIPLFSPVYRALRDISELFLGEKAQAFRRVGLIEWPRPGLWSIVFLTSESPGPAAAHLEGDHVTVFLPTVPNPTTGFVHLVPRRDLVLIEMSVEEAFKVLLSAGAAYGSPHVPSAARASGAVVPAAVGMARAGAGTGPDARPS